MFQTHGFPPELFETLAARAEPGLRLGRLPRGDGAARHRVGRRAEGRTLPQRSAGRPEKAIHDTPLPRLRHAPVDDARVVVIIANERSCDLIDEDDARASRSSWSSTRRPSTARWAARWATRASSSATGFRFEVIDTQVSGALILHRGHLREGRLGIGGRGHAPGSTRPAGRASAAPIRPRTCSTTPCTSTWASTPCNRARRWTTTCCGSTSPTRRRSPPRN